MKIKVLKMRKNLKLSNFSRLNASRIFPKCGINEALYL